MTTKKKSLKIVAGPPRSGKTAWLGQMYADKARLARNAGRLPQLLWLAPHRLAVEAVREQLLGQGLEAALSPGVMTFGRLSDSLLSTQLSTPALLPRSASRWLLRRAMHQAKSKGKLSLLAGVVDRQGLVDAVEPMIGEWKRRGVTASQLEKLAEGRHGTARDRELSAIYACYEAELSRRKAADRFDLDHLAVEMLQGSETLHWDLVIVDRFAGFTRYERELLLQIAARSGEVWVSLALPREANKLSSFRDYSNDYDDNEEEPADLFGDSTAEKPISDQQSESQLSVASLRMQAWLHQHFSDIETINTGANAETSDEESAGVASLARLRSHLFSSTLIESANESASAEELATADRLRVIAASDSHDELVRVVRQIKTLLTSGQVAPHAIVVATPAIRAHRPRLEEVFASFGVPVSIAAPPTVGEASELQALQLLFSLVQDDWPYRQLLDVLRNGLLRALDQPSPSANRWPTIRGAAEWIVRELQIAERQKTLLDSLSRLSELNAASNAGEKTTPRQQAAAIALPILQQIADACGALPTRSSPLGWITASEKLAEELQLSLEPECACAWQTIREAAASIERVSSSPISLSLEEWNTQLRDWGTWMPSSTSLNEEGCVRVLSSEAARYVSVPHLFMVGLTEQSYSSGSGGGLYTEEQYDSLAATAMGPSAIPVAARGYQRSMQLFYDLVTRATESLTFSFAALDNSGQRTPPSPLLDEACRAFGSPLTEALAESPLLTSLPPNDQPPRSHKDWRLLGVQAGLAKKPQLLGALLHNPSTQPVAASLTAAIGLVHHRSHGDSFGPYEGLATTDTARRWLAREYGEKHLWSTSQLETYAGCPYRFFLKHVLRLEPLGDLVLETDHRRLGTIAHRVFVDLHERLAPAERQSKIRVPSDHAKEEFLASFEGAVTSVLESFASFGIDGVLNDLLAEKILHWATSYHQQHEKYDIESSLWEVPLTPTHFELRFGKLRRHADDEQEDVASTDQPLVVDLGDEKILIAGRIDRIDVGQVEGRVVFQVIDYKTAKEFKVTDDDIREGRKLQPALYAMAAAEIVATEDSPAVPLRSGYWLVQKAGFTDKTSRSLYQVEAGQVQPAPGWQELEQAMKQQIKRMVAGVRQGDFPMHNIDEKCTSRCDYSHLCRVGQVRSLDKVWPPPQPSDESLEEPLEKTSQKI